jgi:hypothetical protein
MIPSPKRTDVDVPSLTVNLNAFARNIPDLERSAREGYDVSDQVCEEMAEKTLQVVGDIYDYLVSDTPEFADAVTEDRRAPLDTAFKALDRVTTAVNDVKPWPAGINRSVSRIMKYRTTRLCQNHGRDNYCDDCSPVTVVLVRIGSDIPSVRERVIVVRAEAVQK